MIVQYTNFGMEVFTHMLKPLRTSTVCHHVSEETDEDYLLPSVGEKGQGPPHATRSLVGVVRSLHMIGTLFLYRS